MLDADEGAIAGAGGRASFVSPRGRIAMFLRCRNGEKGYGWL
jgi:hypothetical protein